MKTTLLCYTTILLMLFTAAAPAATLRWSVDGFSAVYQIVADGKGGCAVLGIYPGGMCIVWIDKNGAKLYDKTLVGASSLGILSFDGKALVYNLSGPTLTLVSVDKNGAETPISDAAYHMYGTFVVAPYQPSRAGDKKGFFTAQAPTGPGTWRVARYSHK